MPALPGCTFERPRVVGWSSHLGEDECLKRPNLVLLVAVINGEQLVTLRGI